jgi:hypothetical protein
VGWSFNVLKCEEVVTFATKIDKLLEKTKYHRIDTLEDKEFIYRLRYEAYAREGHIKHNPEGVFHDAEDEVSNVWLIGLYIEGELAGSVRLHVASRPEHYLPITARFTDAIAPKLQSGEVIVDATRMTSKLEFSRAYPCMPYLLMRCAFLAEDHFEANYLTAACRAEYEGAYRRMWGAKRMAGPLPYPPLARPHVVMAHDHEAMGAAVRARYPFLRSTEEERHTLFSKSSNVARDLYDELTSGRHMREVTQHEMACVA